MLMPGLNRANVGCGDNEPTSFYSEILLIKLSGSHLHCFKTMCKIINNRIHWFQIQIYAIAIRDETTG